MAGHRFHRSGFYGRTALFIFILILSLTIFTAIYIPLQIAARVAERVEDSLQTVLHITDRALDLWADRFADEAIVLAARPDLSANVKQQLEIYRRGGNLRTPALRNIRQHLANAIEVYPWAGFTVIAPDGIQIASSVDDEVGRRTIVRRNPSLWPTVESGNIYFGIQFASVLDSQPEDQPRQLVLILAAPVRDDQHKVVAGLALHIDPRMDLTNIVQLGRLQSTGETYAFDRAGTFLTESRFGHVSTTQPMTRMLKSAIQGESGVDIRGYDYSGVKVVGAWLWNPKLNIGLATEMAADEAFASTRGVQRLTVFMLTIILTGAIALVFISAHRGMLQAEALNYQQAVRAREDLMAIVSHDLKNPINSLVLRASILMNGLDRASDPVGSTRKQVELMKDAALRMDTLVSDLTDLTRVESGRLKIEKQQCSIEAIVRPVLDTFTPLIAEKNVQFNVDVPSSLPSVDADPARIGQVISNVLGNALKFTPEGGTIALCVELVRGTIRFEVSDSGPGISKDALPHVFDPYWQMTRSKGGMGLGLFIAKSLIEAHGGRIWIDTRPREGATIQFTLPCSGGISHD